MGLLIEKHAAEVEGILSRYPEKKSAVLLLMHMAQEAYGYMSPDAMNEVAEILALDPTHLLSLAGFYSLYYEQPVGKYVLEICTDLACALCGADEFTEMACQMLDIAPDETTEDGLFTIKKVMCLGACDKAPMLQCNLKFEESLDEQKFVALIARLREQAKTESKAPSVVSRIAGFASARQS